MPRLTRTPTATRIFISYRRSDASPSARLILEALRPIVGAAGVFLDTSAIEPGAPWPDRLRQALADATHVLVVIGTEWLAERDQFGRRRIDDDQDWVRQEIATALTAGKIVIPVLLDGGKLPPGAALPSNTQEMTNRQAVELRTEHWDHDRELLIRATGLGREEVEPEATPSPGKKRTRKNATGNPAGGQETVESDSKNAGSEGDGDPLAAQRRFAQEALNDTAAARFLGCLGAELKTEGVCATALAKPTEVVNAVASCSDQAVQAVSWAICEA